MGLHLKLDANVKVILSTLQITRILNKKNLGIYLCYFIVALLA